MLEEIPPKPPKRCIWCGLPDGEVPFRKRAHSIPQGLGGKDICENVCDFCNEYFGNKKSEGVSIEEAIKETFHISRLRFLYAMGEIGKNKTIQKPDSRFFKFDLSRPSVSVKLIYQLRPGWQSTICRLVKRGLYKMFLEESERQFGNGLDSRFDFIREFARRDIGDYPVYYFTRRHPIILQEVDYPKAPKLYLDNQRLKYLISAHGFQEFEFMSHAFAIVTTRIWEPSVSVWAKETEKSKRDLFTGYKNISRLNDIDLALSILNI